MPRIIVHRSHRAVILSPAAFAFGALLVGLGPEADAERATTD